MAKSTDVSGVPEEAPQAGLCTRDVFTCDTEGIVLTGEGYARMYAALDGIQTIAAIMQQLQVDKDGFGGVQASPEAMYGLISALGVCNEFAQNLLCGQNHFSRVIDTHNAAYQTIERLMVGRPAKA
jgi:hypothetical protein